MHAVRGSLPILKPDSWYLRSLLSIVNDLGTGVVPTSISSHYMRKGEIRIKIDRGVKIPAVKILEQAFALPVVTLAHLASTSIVRITPGLITICGLLAGC